MEKYIEYLGLKIPLDDVGVFQYLCKAKGLKGAFQLETRSAGFCLNTIQPKNIEDLSIVNACNRPGSMKFTKDIGEIRAGTQQISYIDPCLEPFLKETHSKLLYQESVLQIAQKLAGFKATESNNLLKSLGKKDLQKMKSLQESFVNGMVSNGYRKDVAEFIFRWFEDFANYAFNKCHFFRNLVIDENGKHIELKDVKIGDKILAYNTTARIDHLVTVIDIFRSKQRIYQFTLEDGKVAACSLNHRLLCSNGLKYPLLQILQEDRSIATINHGEFKKIVELKPMGIQPTIDLEVDAPDHNFYCQGMVTSNSHSISYSLLGYCSAYIKLHYPLQFFTSLLNYTQYEQSQQDEIFDIVSELPSFNIKLLPPSIKCLNENFIIEREGIRFPIKFIKSIGATVFEKFRKLKDNQTSTLDGILEASFSHGINSRSMEFMIAAGALDAFGEREDLLYIYWVMSELQEEVLKHFWAFQTGRAITRESINEFLKFDQSIPGLWKGSRTGNGYFKTEHMRLKILAKSEEYAKIIDSYKTKSGFCRFVWENFVLGFSYNLHFHGELLTFEELDRAPSGSYSSCGFIDEVMYRTGKHGKPYAILSLKFDKKQSFMLFSEVASGAKDNINESDLVQIRLNKENDKFNVTSVQNITQQAKDVMFWQKKIN